MNRKVSYTQKQIHNIKKRAYEQGQQEALNIANVIPILVLRDKFGFGKIRTERYIDKYLYTIEAYNEGHLTLQDIQKVIKDELGIDLAGFIRR